ncbi:MAG TPA: 6-phosphogluconolactonase [Chthoniobacterales bacterium]
MKPEIIRTRSFAEEAASFIAHAAEEAIEEHGFFRLALSGGNTPRAVYQALALRECRWPKWIVTFGDERCVPPDDPQSNYRMASEAFLMLVGPGEVLRIQGEIDPEEAAAQYNSTLKGLADRFGEERYTHDLILLGLGDDGHTASLFPGTAALDETKKDVVSNFVPKFGSHRITFTYPQINVARRVTFLVSGPKKEAVVQKVLEGRHGYPAERVRPEKGELVWLLG